MDEDQRPDTAPAEEIPWGQRFFDNYFLLLFLCLLIMVVRQRRLMAARRDPEARTRLTDDGAADPEGPEGPEQPGG